MLALFAAALAASSPNPVLEASVPWWEKVTVTVDDKGKQQSCRYESSLSANGAESCDEEMAAGLRADSDGRAGVYSKLTFERRFSPGVAQLDAGQLQPGDQLLGRHVLFLTIDAEGSIENCHIVATSGDILPAYDCEEAKKEQFSAQAISGSGARQAFMTILAYGHSEQIA